MFSLYLLTFFLFLEVKYNLLQERRGLKKNLVLQEKYYLLIEAETDKNNLPQITFLSRKSTIYFLLKGLWQM